MMTAAHGQRESTRDARASSRYWKSSVLYPCVLSWLCYFGFFKRKEGVAFCFLCWREKGEMTSDVVVRDHDDRIDGAGGCGGVPSDGPSLIHEKLVGFFNLKLR